MRRRIAIDALLLLALALAAAFAWATRNPRSPLLDRAAELPLVGPAVGRFLEAYRPPPPAPAGDEPEVEYVLIGPRTAPPPPPGGAAATFDDPLAGARPWILVRAGTALVEAPRAGAAEVLRIDVYANLAVLERRGRWHRVRYGGATGWVEVEPRRESRQYLGDAPEPPRPLPGRAPEPERLALARGLLSGPEVRAQLGAYPLYTDAGERLDLEALAGMAGGLERVYARRYGLAPVCCAREVIVLYARHESYLELQASEDQLDELATEGLASSGLVATFVEGRTASEVAATIAHELAHLLNRRALGPALPPWLDEGIADDLAFSRLAADGRLLPATLGGEEIREGNRLQWKGGAAAAVLTRRALVDRRLPGLEVLLDRDWQGFVGGDASELRYAASAFLVRYLLDSGSSELARGFRGYLADVAAGGSARPEALLARLGTTWEELDAGYRRWLGEWLAAPVESVAASPPG